MTEEETRVLAKLAVHHPDTRVVATCSVGNQVLKGTFIEVMNHISDSLSVKVTNPMWAPTWRIERASDNGKTIG